VSWAAQAWQFVLAGGVTGGIFALVALGFALIYQVSGIINFAQGEFPMLGAMVTASLAGAGVPLPAAVPAAVAVGAAAGALVERVAVRPARHATPVVFLFLTLAADIALRGAALFVWGTNPLTVPPFSGGDAIRVLGGALPRQALWVLGADAAAAAALFAFLRFTFTGAAVRAAMVNPAVARAFGMRPDRFRLFAFALAAAIGALGGAVVAPVTNATYDMGLYLGLNGFVAAVLGGLDSLPGAVAGGFALGILEKLAGGFLPAGWEQGIAFFLLLVILLVRPQGLLGREVRRA
jgi:branched-chain amino acid transport system permease protein